MASEAAKAIARIGADTREYEQKMAQADRKWKETTRSMEHEADRMAGAISGGMAGIAGALGVAGFAALGSRMLDIGHQIYDAAGATLQLGESAERSMGVLTRLYGRDAYSAVNKLREATLGAVDAQTLMASASQLSAMGLAKNTDEAARLLRIASQLGAAGPAQMTPMQAVADFSMMLANQSYMRMDQFGISSAAVRARVSELSTEMAGASDETIFYAAVMGEAEEALKRIGEVAPTTSEQLRRATADLNLYFAQWASGTVLSSFGDAQRGVGGWLADASDMFKNIVETRRLITDFQNDVERAYSQGLFSTEQAQGMIDASHAWRQETELGGVAADELTGRIEDLVTSMSGGIPSAEQWAAVIGAGADAAYDAASAYDALQASISDSGTQSAKRAYEMAQLSLQGQLAYVRSEIQALDPTDMQGYYKLKKQELDIQAAITRESERGLSTRIDLTDRLAEAERRRVEGLIESQIALTRPTERDFLETQFGLYEDRPDEYIRRLRSAVEDADSAWKDLLGGRSGDEAKLYLMQQEEAFASGRWEQLGAGFDREQAMEAVRRQVREQLDAEARRQQLVDEIYASMGGAASRSQVAAALGAPMQAQGELAKEQFLSGAEDIGLAFTDQFDRQLAAQEARWVGFGGAVLGWIREGMEAGVNGEFIEGLVEVLTPRLKAELAGVP